MNGHFALDIENAKLLGVCAGISRWADSDPSLPRLTVVLMALALGPVAILAYLVTALVAAKG